MVKKLLVYIFSITLFLQVCGVKAQCNPDSTLFAYTGDTQTFIVPPCVTSITVKVWGAGGGGGGPDTYPGQPGGGGAYSLAIIAVTPGEALTVQVGGGGKPGGGCVTATQPGPGGYGYGNGGTGGEAGPTGCSGSGGGGGGGTALLHGITYLVVAGGGGGGGGGGNISGAGAGGGGGQNGWAGTGPGGITGASASINGTNGVNMPIDGGGPGGGGGGELGGTAGGDAGCDCGGGGGGGGGNFGSVILIGNGTTPGYSNYPTLPFGDAVGGPANAGWGGKGGGNGYLIIEYCAAKSFTLSMDSTGDKCAGSKDGTATVTAKGGNSPYTYTWSPSGGANTKATGLSAGTYKILVKDAGGCQDSATVVITQPPALTLTAAGFPVSCFGNSDGQATVIPKGGTGAYTYIWTPLGGTNANANGLSADTYTVTVTDANGCTHDTSVVVSQPAKLRDSIAAFTNVLCNGGNNATATAGVKGGTTPYVYSWTPSGGNGATATALTAGSYTVNIKDKNGCTASASVTITQPTALVITNAATKSICIGQSATLTPTYKGGTPVYSYNWTPNLNLNCNTCAGPIASPTVTIVYTVTLTDANGCTLTATDTVYVSPPLVLAAGTSQGICPGGNVNLNSLATGGDGVYTYSWGPAAGLSCTGCQDPVATPAVTTTYTVHVTDGCGTPADSALVTITVYPLPVVSFAADSLSGCAPLCIGFKDLTTLASGNIASWAWNFGDSASGSDLDTNQNPRHCYNAPGKYTVSLKVTSDEECSSSITIPGMISVYSNPVAAFTFGPQPVNILNPVVSFTDKSTDVYGIASWLWNFGEINSDASDTLRNPIHKYEDTGTYCATLKVTNFHGCTDSITQCFVINPLFTLYIPDAFSPNSDGLNDVFEAKGKDVYNFNMYIFDRWGMLLYYTDDINKGWNGTVSGGSTICQVDTYVYLITCQDNLGNKHKYIGKITLTVR